MLALQVESWIWWSVVMLVAASRFISRWMTLGSFRRYQADDYLMMIALCFYTALIATINIVRDASSNLLPPGFNVNSLTNQDIQEREYGSKLILVVEQCQCATIWLVKGCLTLLYLRLTTMRREHIAIKVLAAYIVVTFIVMDSLYFGFWCQPFHEYWAVPTDSRQCDAATNHLITNAVFNLTSDIAMIVIGLPMFLRLKLPWRKKGPLIGVFSLGMFTIVAAILNKVYSFSNPFGSAWTYWYTRESSTALLVANLPFVWAMWRKIVSGRGSVQETSRQNSHTLGPTRTRTIDGVAVGNGSMKTAAIAGGRRSTAEDLGIDLEMDEIPRGFTIADMLADGTHEHVDEKDVNEYTHPYLFYSRMKTGEANNGQSAIPRAALKTSPELQTIRRDSDFDQEQSGTPTSSMFPSLDTKRSANSLV